MNTPDSLLTFGKLVYMELGQPVYSLIRYFGDERYTALLRNLLIPCGRYADTLPCDTYDKKTCDRHCPRKIMYSHDLGRYAAYCPEFTAKDFYVPEDELRMFKTNMPKAIKTLAAALRVQGEPETVNDNRTWCLGEIASSASVRHPVYLIADVVHQVAEQHLRNLLLFEIQKTSLIFAVGGYVPSAEITRLLGSRLCLVRDIDSCVNVECDGTISISAEGERLLSNFVSEAKKSESNCKGFQFPKGKTWEHLSVHILDGDMVTFDIDKSISKHRKSDLKLGKVLWNLLLAFANKNGRLPSSFILSSDAKRKQIQRLNDAWTEYCKSPIRPFELSSDKSEYVCRFALKPEWHSTSYHESRKKT